MFVQIGVAVTKHGQIIPEEVRPRRGPSHPVPADGESPE